MHSHSSTSTINSYFHGIQSQITYEQLHHLLNSYEQKKLYLLQGGYSCEFSRNKIIEEFDKLILQLNVCMGLNTPSQAKNKKLAEVCARFVDAISREVLYETKCGKNARDSDAYFSRPSQNHKNNRLKLLPLPDFCKAAINLNSSPFSQAKYYIICGNIYSILLKLHTAVEAVDDSDNLAKYRQYAFANYIKALDLDPNCIKRKNADIFCGFLENLSADELIAAVQQFSIPQLIIILKDCLNENNVLGNYIARRNIIQKGIDIFRINSYLETINPQNKKYESKLPLEKLEKDYQKLSEGYENNENKNMEESRYAPFDSL